ncbi:MAG: hypothetical protein JWN39_2229 [Ilumatobacteraceae bacterium]|nr:hypothetical protein [Ilumatobacteraceae bacterium]
MFHVKLTTLTVRSTFHVKHRPGHDHWENLSDGSNGLTWADSFEATDAAGATVHIEVQRQRHQSQGRQQILRPTSSLVYGRGLRDQHHTCGRQERCRAAQGEARFAERPRGHDVIHPAMTAIPAEADNIRGQHRHPIGDPELSTRQPEQIHPPLSPIDENHAQVGPSDRNDQTGQTTSGPEVDQ